MPTYAAHNLNEDVRKNSSSGGIFYSLANHVLSQKGIVFGAAWNESWLVDMCYVDKLEDLSKLLGSKYLQANTKETFKECKEFLEAGKLVLYSGLPCQLHGLKVFLKKEYENLIMVDIACHGLPLPQIWTDYLETIKRPDANITSINFRLKDPDWNNYAFEVKYSDGKILKEHHSKNKYMQAFLCDKYLKTSCYNCKFKNDFSCADITIGDAWGAGTKFDSKNGISFIITRTTNGEKLLNNLDIKKDKIIYNDPSKNGCLKNKINTKPCIYTKDIIKKKVAIITLHLFDNIGGILQAFALNKLVTEAGYIAETITWKDSRLLPFAKNNIKLRILNSASDIKYIKENEYDIFISGSDQIWRKKYTQGEFRDDYITIPFLQFTNGWNKTRISYAASIGVAESTWEYNKDDCEKIKQLLQAFNAVSVREIQSINDCKKYFNIEPEQCIDPTMLLPKETYIELCKDEPINNNDVFINLLDETPEKINIIADYCKENKLSYFKNKRSVESWLAVFRDAKYIITDSFHGCIFAIIFNKPFICLYNRARGNARFDSLIKLFNINNIIYSLNELKTVQFSRANTSNIEQKIANDKDFLFNALALPPNKMDAKIDAQKIQTANKQLENKKRKQDTYLYF